MKPIHVDYAPKLIKWKNKIAFIEFLNRFYSPVLFIGAFLSAFEWLQHDYAMWLLPLLSIISSVCIAYYSWKRWKKDFIYLVEDTKVVPCQSFLKILICESILQFLVSILSLWWISGVPTCITHWTSLKRHTQAYIWSVLLIFVFILHVVQWKMNSKEMDKIVRNTYDHLQSEV